MADTPLRLGISGLGRGFMLLLPTLAAHPGIRLTAATDPRQEARAQFAADFSGFTTANFEELCQRTDVDAIYIASPHQFHLPQVKLAAQYGKHVLVEKPMALSLADCQTMVDVMQSANRWLLVGHSHSFDTPYQETARLIQSGETGQVRMITAFNYTDFLYRPRRPEELDTSQGGGVVFSQAAHQVDIVRLLGGGEVTTVRAHTGSWDPTRPTEGAYSALLSFANGAFANITYSGYAHFDSDEWLNWQGELGQRRSPKDYGKARNLLATINNPREEAALKNKRAYGDGLTLADASLNGIGHNHFGHFLVSCDRCDLRPTPQGIDIFGHTTRDKIPLDPPEIPRREVLDELIAAVDNNEPPVHSGAWGMATMEVCFAVLESARDQKEVKMRYQQAVPATH